MSSDSDAATERPSWDDAPENSEGVPLDVDAESGKQAFLQALRVRQTLKRSAIGGAAFALAVFVFFVVIPGTYRSPVWYVALAFVLAVSVAGFLVFALTLANAYRLSKRL